eukprot:scaffold15611_cov190-Skeletonema_marinoi.AAC.5
MLLCLSSDQLSSVCSSSLAHWRSAPTYTRVSKFKIHLPIQNQQNNHNLSPLAHSLAGRDTPKQQLIIAPIANFAL